MDFHHLEMLDKPKCSAGLALEGPEPPATRPLRVSFTITSMKDVFKYSKRYLLVLWFHQHFAMAFDIWIAKMWCVVFASIARQILRDGSSKI